MDAKDTAAGSRCVPFWGGFYPSVNPAERRVIAAEEEVWAAFWKLGNYTLAWASASPLPPFLSFCALPPTGTKQTYTS